MSMVSRPPAAHVVWGNIEVSWSDSWDKSVSAEGVEVRKEESHSRSSLTPSQQARHSSRSSREQERMAASARPPQTSGDQGLEVNSDCEAVPNNQSQNHELHNSGRCRPCNYFFKSVGCNNGDNCTFCHLAHPDLARARPCKTKRERCKDVIKTQAGCQSQPECRLQEMAARQSLQGSYMRNILSSRTRSQGGAP